MYICVCNAISDRSVRECTAKSVAEVFRCHGTRPQCGQCARHMRRLLNEARKAVTTAANSMLAEAAD